MTWRGGLGRQVVLAAAASLAATAVVLVIALTGAAGTRAASRELSGRLVPAAAAAGALLKSYQAQQGALRDYVTSGEAADLAPYRAAGRQIPGQQSGLAALVRSYPPMGAQLAAGEAAQRVWAARIAGPQLAAAARGDFARARALQADIIATRPYTLAVRTRIAALQALITSRQAAVTGALVRSQGLLIWSLVAMCVLVAVIAIGAVVMVRRTLLAPFTALRRAAESVAAGNYASPIPAQGPQEFAELARSTEHMRAELVTALADRQRAEHRFRRLFDAAPDATVAVAADGTIIIANPQAEALCGYPPGELAGQNAVALIPDAGTIIEAAHRADSTAGSPQRPGDRPELAAIRRDGRGFPAEVSLSALPGDGEPLALITIRDISARLTAQGEQDRLRAEAEEQRTMRRLEQHQRLESLGQLVGGVAHDFNNLLNIISGYTTLTTEQITPLALHDDRLRPALADLGQVREAAEQAARVTRQLLIFARHDVINPEPLNLADIVASAGTLLTRTLGERIDLNITSDPGLWPVTADRGQLEQVLVNLAINARDAMPRGGSLTIETSNLDVDDAYATTRPGLHPGRYTRLRVSDSGTGMDQTTIDRVFEPFFTTKPKGHGTGLGLSTVYGIITSAGGTVQIYSEPGMGTTITALLPATSDTPQPPAPTAPAAEDHHGNGQIILLAEDEKSLRQLAHRILTRRGYHVHQATTETDAITYAADPAHHIDLLLTDVVMPQMLGTDLAATIHQTRPALPVIFMSGYAQPILDTHGATSPSLNILEKPFTETTLLTRIHHALHNTASPHTS